MIAGRAKRLRASFQMLGQDGNTTDSLRGLIAVPPEIERVLQAFAKADPSEYTP